MINDEVAVFVGRVQINKLHEGYRHIFDQLIPNYKDVLVVICSAKELGTERDPLDVQNRIRMIHSAYPLIENFAHITDIGNIDKWSIRLDEIIEEYLKSHLWRPTPILVGSRDSFLDAYNGKFQTRVIESIDLTISSTKLREEIGKNAIDSEEFRAGIIYAAYNRKENK